MSGNCVGRFCLGVRVQVVVCKNRRIKNGRTEECGRFLAELSDDIVDHMMRSPGAAIRLRCPVCHKDDRFIKLLSVNGELHFATDAPTDRPDYQAKRVAYQEISVVHVANA
jgi:hypothetical protein